MSETSQPTPAPAETGIARPGIVLARPIVLRGMRKSSGKRRYSSGLKTVQKTGRGLNRATARLAEALDDGASRFYSRSDRSSVRKRDGAIKDGMKNWAKGLTRSIRTASKAPDDLLKRVDTKGFSRGLRQIAKTIALPIAR